MKLRKLFNSNMTRLDNRELGHVTNSDRLFSAPTDGCVVVFLVVAMFAAKLALAFHLIGVDPGFFTHDDGVKYTHLADSLFRSGEFLVAGQSSETRRLPLFPAYLSISYHVGDSGQMYLYAAMSLSLFHLWLMLMSLHLIKSHGRTSAFVFIALMSASVLWLHYTVATHSEFLFSILLIGGFVIMDRVLQNDAGHRRLAALSSAIGLYALCYMTRPDLLLFPAFFVVYGFLISRPASLAFYRRRLFDRSALVFVFSGYVLVLGWVVRNWITGNGFLYTSQTREILPRYVNRLAELHPEYLKLNFDHFTMVEKLVFFQETILDFAYISAKGMLILFFSMGRWFFHRYMEALGFAEQIVSESLFNQSLLELPPAELAYIGFRLAFFSALYVSFVLFLARNRDRQAWGTFAFLMAPVCYLVSMQIYWGAGMRFLTPVVPFMAYFAALAFSRIHAGPEAAPPGDRIGRMP